MRRCFTALFDTLWQPEGKLLVTPPWEALRLYTINRDRVTHAYLENAADMIFEAMRDAHVDFTIINRRTGLSLLVYAISHGRCAHLLLNKLFSLGVNFSSEELASGEGMAVVLRNPGIAPTALHHLSYKVQNRVCSNTRIESVPDGGTALHLACREAPIVLLQLYIHTLLFNMQVNPALLNDRLLAPHQILAQERLVPGVTSQHDERIIRNCIRSLIEQGGQANISRKHAVNALRHKLKPDLAVDIARHSLAAVRYRHRRSRQAPAAHAAPPAPPAQGPQ